MRSFNYYKYKFKKFICKLKSVFCKNHKWVCVGLGFGKDTYNKYCCEECDLEVEIPNDCEFVG